MEESLEYWQNIRDQRLEDIACQEAIGNPDKELMNILLEALTGDFQLVDVPLHPNTRPQSRTACASMDYPHYLRHYRLE